jgi:peptidoglycan/LPS O-acetylase OafA/YrhL
MSPTTASDARTADGPIVGPIAAPTAPTVAVPPPKAGRLAALDGLRFIAALSVLFGHYVAIGGYGLSHWAWGRPPQEVFPSLFPFASYGWTGVELFFLISGFVICMSSWGRSLGQFFTSRVVRLFPTYLFVVGLSAVVLWALPQVAKPLGVRELLTNLTMLQRPLGVRSIQAPFWTLWVELRFYLLFAIVVWLGVTYRRAVLFCVLWTVGSVLALGTDSAAFIELLAARRSPYFVAGVALYLIYRFGPTLLLWGIVGFSWLLSLHHLPGENNWNERSGQPNWPAVILVTAAYAIMILLALHVFDRVNWRGLTVLGAISYPLYLLHEYVGYALIYRLHVHVEAHVLLILMMLLMIAAGWLIHRLVERPLAVPVRRGLTRGLAAIRADSAPR